MSEAWFLWHMWGTAPWYVSLPSSDYAVYSVLTLLFIASPSEHPSLIFIVFIIIVYILSDPSPPFQLTAAGEESQEEKRGKRCGTKLWRGPRLFAFVRSCQSLQLPRRGWGSVQTEKSCSAAVRAAAWCCYWAAESRARGQQSSEWSPTGRFKWAERKDGFAVTLLSLCVSFLTVFEQREVKIKSQLGV